MTEPVTYVNVIVPPLKVKRIPAGFRLSPKRTTKDLAVIKKAIRVAGKKLRIHSDKTLNQNLEFCCGDLAEAYRVGAEEAQHAIVDRLVRLSLEVIKTREAKCQQ